MAEGAKKGPDTFFVPNALGSDSVLGLDALAVLVDSGDFEPRPGGSGFFSC
jgi:hypothetical protein